MVKRYSYHIYIIIIQRSNWSCSSACQLPGEYALPRLRAISPTLQLSFKRKKDKTSTATLSSFDAVATHWRSRSNFTENFNLFWPYFQIVWVWSSTVISRWRRRHAFHHGAQSSWSCIEHTWLDRDICSHSEVIPIGRLNHDISPHTHALYVPMLNKYVYVFDDVSMVCTQASTMWLNGGLQCSIVAYWCVTA